MHYTYHRVALMDGSPSTAADFAEWVGGTARLAAQKAGGELLGLFLPQLGSQAHERLLLLRWRGEAGDALSGCPYVGAVTTDRLRPTARPADTDQLRPRGIFVHRWFTIDPKDEEAFVALSRDAWVGFESEFAGNPFGLFAAEPKTEDGASMRMLLMTRYGGHADWEASRRPSADVADIFARRRELTRATGACSTVIAALS
ncbi:MAG TPA: hypothetical protein VG227_07860 [Caulobacteraceae bacterium]|jgi:hypothetical protein|nr:hypothetical protein [Caulobacteraceae bacterium]